MRVGIRTYQNLPLARNLSFSAREGILYQLGECLGVRGQPDDISCSVLYGLGGAGKSQIAAEFAYRHLDTFPVVFWLAAETPEKLGGLFADLATVLELADDSMQPPDVMRELVKEWLVSRSTTGEGHAQPIPIDPH